MMIKIDSIKTIASNKMFYIACWKKLFTIIFYIIAIFIPLFIAIQYAIHSQQQNNRIIIPIMLAFMSSIIAHTIYKQLKTRNDIIRISDIDKKYIIIALKDLNWTIVEDNQQYMIIKAASYRKQISIVFDNKDLLINSINLSLFNCSYSLDTSSVDILMDKIEEIKNIKF